MLIKCMIVIFLILVSSVQVARAELACQMIDTVLVTFSIVKDIQFDSDNRHYSENMAKLSESADKVLLPILIPQETGDAFPAESAALFHYISNIREAVAGMDSGYDDYAKTVLKNSISSDFPRSLQSLSDYWGCSAEQTMVQMKGTALKRNGSYVDTPMAANQKTSGDVMRSVLGHSSSDNRAIKNSVLTGVSFGGVEMLKFNSPMLFLMFLFALAIMVYWGQRRSKRIKTRERRRIVNKLVNVGIGKAYYPMVVVDISMNGFKMQHSGVVDRRCKLNVQFDGTWYWGHIKWHNDLFAGVKFRRPLNHQTFNAIVQSFPVSEKVEAERTSTVSQKQGRPDTRV